MYLLLIRGLLVRYIRDMTNVLLWSRKKNNLQSIQQMADSVTEDLFEENPEEEQVWTRSNCIRTIVWDYKGTREVISFHLNITTLVSSICDPAFFGLSSAFSCKPFCL